MKGGGWVAGELRDTKKVSRNATSRMEVHVACRSISALVMVKRNHGHESGRRTVPWNRCCLRLDYFTLNIRH
eukprot:scaffold2383_cov161-Amphora_coffeaeformis.AAC.38